MQVKIILAFLITRPSSFLARFNLKIRINISVFGWGSVGKWGVKLENGGKGTKT